MCVGGVRDHSRAVQKPNCDAVPKKAAPTVKGLKLQASELLRDGEELQAWWAGEGVEE